MTARRDPYDLTAWRGVQLDRRTVAQLLWAERRRALTAAEIATLSTWFASRWP